MVGWGHWVGDMVAGVGKCKGCIQQYQAGAELRSTCLYMVLNEC